MANTHSTTRGDEYTMTIDFAQVLGGPDYTLKEGTADRLYRMGTELEKKRRYEKFTVFDTDVDEMIIINDIKVSSFCEHHLLPYMGMCSIGYIPNGKLLGLSKFQRLVDQSASRPTLQESLTRKICQRIEYLLNPFGIAIIMKCSHTCATLRGVESHHMSMNTQVMTGILRDDPAARQEFISRVQIS